VADFGKLIYIFIQGFTLGMGPCLLVCAPILFPYIAGTRQGWKEGLRAALVFSLARMVVYSLLGGVMGYIGFYLFNLFYNQTWGRVIWALAGLFIAIAGLQIIIGKKIENPFCRYLSQREAYKNDWGMFLLGILIGLTPCLPLLLVLTEIMFIAQNFFQGLLYGAAFGVGTLLSPLLLVGALAPIINLKFKHREKLSLLFNNLCGIMLILFGFYLILR